MANKRENRAGRERERDIIWPREGERGERERDHGHEGEGQEQGRKGEGGQGKFGPDCCCWCGGRDVIILKINTWLGIIVKRYTIDINCI